MCESGPVRLSLASEAATREAGRRLGRALRDVENEALLVGFSGELGAGKTTFVAGVLAAFGVSGPVRSPTYTLIEPYDVDGRRLYHLDLYRIGASLELEALAVRDLFEPAAVLLVEWVERGAGVLPQADLTVCLSYAGDAAAAAIGRVVEITAGSERGREALSRFRADSADEKNLLSS